jgi:pyridoxine kinase
MHSVLENTLKARDEELRTSVADEEPIEDNEEARQKREYLRRTKAAEVRLVRNVKFLRDPVVHFKAQEWTE